MLLVFDHNWKKELEKKRNDSKDRDFREVITASRAIQGYCWYIRSLTAGESGSCLGKSQKSPWWGQWPNQLWQLNSGALKGRSHAHGLHEPCDICTDHIISGTWGLQVGSPDSWTGGWPEGEDVLHMALSQQPTASDLMHAFVALLWNAFKKRGPAVAK